MDSIVSKANEVGELESRIQSERLAQKELYAEIGRIYYETISDRSQLNEPIAMLVSQVDDAIKKVNELQEKMDQIKKEKRCPVCGRSYDPDFIFCAGCGAKLEAVLHQQVEHRCPKCGEEINAEDFFCFRCGYRLK